MIVSFPPSEHFFFSRCLTFPTDVDISGCPKTKTEFEILEFVLFILLLGESDMGHILVKMSDWSCWLWCGSLLIFCGMGMTPSVGCVC